MTTLIDKFGILNNIEIQGGIDHIKVFFQNVLNNNIVFHPFLLSNILKNNTDHELLLNDIGIIFDSYNREKRQHFRNLSKQSKLTETIIIEYICKYINILRTINSYLYSSQLSYSTYNKDYKWGDSQIIKKGIISIINVIMNDKIIDSVIKTSIEQNNNLYHLVKNIRDMDIYNSYNQLYNNTINKIEKCIETTITNKISNDIPDKFVNNIYRFKNTIEHYLFFKNKFKYIKKEKFLNSIFEITKLEIRNIVTSVDIITLKCFINNYKEYFKKLNDSEIYSYLSIGLVFISFSDNNILYNNNKIHIRHIGELLDSIISISNDDNISKAIFSQINKEVFENDFIIGELVNIINYNIINKESNNIYVDMINYIKNKDVFYKLMEQKLMERLVYQSGLNNDKITNEYTFFNKLKTCNNSSDLIKYKTIIDDFNKNSIVINGQNNKNLYVMTENMWNINVNNGYGIIQNSKNGNFSQLCNDYKNLYQYEHHVDNLLYHLDIGYVDITIINNKGRTNIRMLPIQLVCFELFSKNQTYTKLELLSKLKEILVTYKDNFIENVLQSLVNGKLLLFNENKLSENKDFNIPNYNFINEFNKLNDTKNKTIMKIFDDISFSRTDIINTNINSILKTSELSKQNLFQTCKEQIKLFDMDMKMFNKSIKCMIDKDYIKLTDNGVYYKLVY